MAAKIAKAAKVPPEATRQFLVPPSLVAHAPLFVFGPATKTMMAGAANSALISPSSRRAPKRAPIPA